jgi:hypothetical protein
MIKLTQRPNRWMVAVMWPARTLGLIGFARNGAILRISNEPATGDAVRQKQLNNRDEPLITRQLLLGCLASGPVAAGELPVWVFLTCTRANWRCAPFAVNRLNNIHSGLQSYASGLIELSSGTYRAKSLGRARHFDFRRCSGQECWPLAP